LKGGGGGGAAIYGRLEGVRPKKKGRRRGGNGLGRSTGVRLEHDARKEKTLTRGPGVSAEEERGKARQARLAGLDELGSAQLRGAGEKRRLGRGEEAKRPKKKRGGGRPSGRIQEKNKFLSPFLFLIFQIHFQMIFEIIFFLK
jgi:hypothetical protein